MTDVDDRRTYPPEVVDKLRDLEVVTARIETTDKHLRSLYERRRGLFRFLLDNKVPQAQIARVAHVTGMSVSLAVGKGAKKETAPAAKPKRAKAPAG